MFMHVDWPVGTGDVELVDGANSSATQRACSTTERCRSGT